MKHEIPAVPWQKVGSDLFVYDGDTYVIMVDYYSNYFEIKKLQETRSTNIIHFCKQQFARFGIPNILMSDNGPQYVSAEFKKFSKAYGFKHVTSSPMYPQSNGKTEKAVQIAKNLIKKSKLSGQDPYIALLNFRNTPQEDLESPVQLLMGRRTQTLLPTYQKLMKPEIPKNVEEKFKRRAKKQTKYFNRGAKLLPFVKVGDAVGVRFGKEWKPGMVVAKSQYPRSFVVQIGVEQYRRNRRDLRILPNLDVPQFGYDVDDQEESDTPTHRESPIITSRRGRIIKPNRDVNFSYY